jgi:hypothetical protein
MNARLFFGVVVLVLGVAWTLDNLGIIDASQYLQWWPAVALGWGLLLLAGIGVRQQTVPGLFWTVIGGAALLNTLDLIHISIFHMWPLLLIAVGGSIVARAWRGEATNASGAEPGARFNTFVLMGGTERKVTSQSFRHGELSAVMGGVVADFRSAVPADGHAVIDVFAMWGGIELIVPVGWKVVGDVTPILGGFDDSTVPPTDPSAPTLVVRGIVIMGGVEVRHDRRDEATRRGAHAGIHYGEQR